MSLGNLMRSNKPLTSGILFLLPLSLVIIIAFDIPVAMLVITSFMTPDLSLKSYQEILSTSIYVRIFSETVQIAGFTTTLCILLGYPLAYWVFGLSARLRAIILTLLVMSFWVSILVRTYAWTVLLGRAGLVNDFLMWLGLVREPVAMLFNRTGVVIGMTNVLLPFFTLPLLASLLRFDRRLVLAAASLGASRFQIFRWVFFPLSLPSLSASSTLVFILAMGFYITPALLGGGRVPMMANVLDLLINQLPNWEHASAISLLLLLITYVLYAFYLKFQSSGQIRR